MSRQPKQGYGDPAEREKQAVLCEALKPNAPAKIRDATRAILKADPALFEILSPHEQALAAITANTWAGQEVALLELACEQHALQIRDSMGYARASALERTVIESVVRAYFRMTAAERHLAVVQRKATVSSQVAVAERSLLVAQRIYTQHVETLARFQRRQAPMIQVNIADQQQIVGQAIAERR